MLLSESYKNRLRELSGLGPEKLIIWKEAADLYLNSSKRVKFDVNLMKQAIDGGMEVGLVFQSNNVKYKMPIWKMRVIQPVAMGYDKKGQLVIRGIHVEGQSEKKAIETGQRSAQAHNEWRLFKASNIKSMFFTGRLFNSLSLGGYNPNDSVMKKIIVSFDAGKANEYQKQLKIAKKAAPKAPISKPKTPLIKPAKPKVVVPKTPIIKPIIAPETKEKENAKALQQKLDRLKGFI